MKNSSEKEEPGDKKGYIFFSDPNVIVKRAETSAIRAQIAQGSEIQQQPSNLQVSTLGGIKSLENLLSYHPVQPYPFTFISAVKQKLALGDSTETGARACDSNSSQRNNLATSVLRANSTQNLYQIVQKMDLVRPLKVPDLKISPKTLDFSGRENSISKELPSKSEIATKEFALDRPDKASRTGERVQRKLDFSSSDASIINCESIEPLKAPNVSIAFNLSKKKEHVRDSSREKENRSKRMKKDESLGTKREESAQDQVKRSRSPRHLSRKDAIDTSNVTRLPLSKNDRLPFHATKSNDSLSAKSKVKSFVTSTAKKDSDKKQKSLNAQSVELSRDNSLSKGRIPSNESSAFRPWKAVDKVTLKDNNSVGILSSNSENKSKDISHSRQRPEAEDLKYKCDLDNRQSKQEKSNTIHKEQTKRVSDKSKASNKVDGKLHGVNSEPLEDVGSMSESNSSKNRASAYPASSVQQTKSNDSETITESKENVNLSRSTKTSENFRYTEHSVTQSASTSIKKDDESCSQSIITTKETTANDSNDVDTALPDALFDPRRISFREGYHPQEEFPNLVTPERMNLVLRSNRRRYLIQSSDSEVDARCPKYKSMVKQEKEQEEVQLMHPTALHMQFQAELHLYDSFNESLRQVMDVEKRLYNTNKREQEQKSPQREDVKDEELEKTTQVGEDRAAVVVNDEAVEKTAWNTFDYKKRDIDEAWKSNDDAHFTRDHYIPNQENIDEPSGNNRAKPVKMLVKVAEVQTQTVNDIATQTWGTPGDKRNTQKDRFLEIRGNLYERSFSGENEAPQLSLDSAEQFEDLDQIEEISLPSKIRTMSEISLHETTSSIKTETGTEISISTRDVTCSFNKYLDLEIAKLIKDENQRCNKIEMLFKSREKTLNDRTKKLVKLEEQKRALKDTGQDSRSVKKKQRALLLKLQQEKDEMYRLKQLYEITSQERKLMLQKQRDMFNPEMSTKNILTKLKRSADSQSPRRLSGPMKGYDIRSNSSMSSLIDSDKSQHDRSQVDTRLHASESDINSSKLDLLRADKFVSLEESNVSATRFDDLAEKPQKRYELKSRRYEDKMPRADVLRLKQNQLEIESKRIHGHPMKIKRLLENQGSIEVSPQPSRPELDVSMPDYVKSESDTLVEELSKRSRTSQVAIPTVILSKEKALASDLVAANSSEAVEEETNVSDVISKTTKSSQVSEELLQASTNKSSKKVEKSVTSDKDMPRKLQHSAELKTSSKRKSSKYQRTKSSSSTLTENISRSKSSSHMPEELIKHHDKRTRMENELLQLDNKENFLLAELDLDESENSLQALVRRSKAVKDKNSKLLSEIISESKENVCDQNKRLEIDENFSRNEQDTRNVSQISFAVSHHSSGESENNFSKSIVVRSEERDFKTSKNLKQILTAREAALASRKNCVEEWMAWHKRLRAEEDRVACMEKAAFKLIKASNVLSQQDTTVSSDTSDVEGRIELLTEKLAERRIEMARLKKEAKNQAKKQLRALEANLLNQIKRYDTTIHEMRKKLESKRAIKETDKLAIEPPKSLADFKVPEIPLKRIQDLYKSSDLLRSRSEPDLLLTRSQLDLLRIATPIVYDDERERDCARKATKSADTKSTNATELKDVTDNRSAHTVFDEYTSDVYDNFRTTTSISSASNDPRSEKYVSSTERQLDVSTAVGMKQWNASHDAQTSLGTVRSELEAQTVSDARLEDHSTIDTESADDKSITEHTRTKTPVTQSEILEMGNLRSIPSKSDYVTESAHIPTVATDSNILTYSKKLDFLQLNNKNLSEDISSIENDIKALSEIMSRLSNESNEKSKANRDEISTSRDISEVITKTIFSDKVTNTADEEKQTISSERENSVESRSPSESSRDKYISDRIDNEISMIIPEEVPALSNSSTHEIDYEAKSKEIMNQIEKSIISEHVKMAYDDYNAISALENEKENLLSDMVSELDVKSISEILSKAESESRRSLDVATNSATPIVDGSKKDTSERSEMLNEIKLGRTHLSKISGYSSVTSMQSPIIAGHRSKESYETDLQGDPPSARSIKSSETSHAISKGLKSSEHIPEELEIETSIVDDSKILTDPSKNIQPTNDTINSIIASNVDENRSISAGNISRDKDDWTTSDSFQVPQDEISTGERDTELESTKSHLDHTDTLHNFSGQKVDDTTDDRQAESNLAGVADISVFIPKGESTNVDATFNNASSGSHVMKSNNELDDILDIIAKESQEARISSNKSENVDDAISDSVAELLSKVEDILQDKEEGADDLKGILCDNVIDINDSRIELISNASMLNDKVQNEMNFQVMGESNVASVNTRNDDNEANNREGVITDVSSLAIGETDDKPAIDVSLHVEIEEDSCQVVSEAQEIIITELDSDSVEDHALSELEVDANVELAEEKEEESVSSGANRDKDYHATEENKAAAPVEIKESLEPILEQDSSDGEQLDNLVEVAESGLDTVEKLVSFQDSSESVIDEVISVQTEEAEKETANDEATVKRSDETAVIDAETIDNINKTFDILKDPEYEDISEESLEVSEILDKHDDSRAGSAKRSTNLPDTYRAAQKSEEVLRILDEISQKSTSDPTSSSRKDKKDDTPSARSVTEEISELLGVEVSAGDDGSSRSNRLARDKTEEESYDGDESRARLLVEAQKRSIETNDDDVGSEEKSTVPLRSGEHDAEDKPSEMMYELRERVSQLQEQDGSSESSEAGDTPRGVSEIEMDSPRDFNDSRLDIDILDDDLLSGTKTTGQSVDVKSNFHSTSVVVTSEKDIEAMIDKLKASLEQPGLEVAELEAKLLHIEQLQIELEIKKLEAEEVSYYVRDIPNKPPPPYTPPGDDRLSTSLGSPSLVTAVIPSNVEELTSFTEKATALIYNAKLAGEDIASLEAPPEIYELTKDKNEMVKRDRRIYNTFLFDLCKETIVEVYQAEYEKPGPSWTKPNVKTKPTVKIPKTVEELIEYVNKEVATLFGFKTKLQRENMVMRWSRKRRDRVDELLAREAQAEEDEWTKFHHDELTVKNGLTVAILDTLVMETANVVKVAYDAKRRMMV